MKKKCYKCKCKLADKTMLGIAICNECSHKLLKAAILCDYHNLQVRKRKLPNKKNKTSIGGAEFHALGQDTNKEEYEH